METNSNISIYETRNPELCFDREMKAVQCVPVVVGAVLNKTTYEKLKNKSTLHVAQQTPWRHNNGGWSIRHLTATIYDGVVVFVKKHQRGTRLFYDLTKLSEYLNGS